jgi:hypothetical protein
MAYRALHHLFVVLGSLFLVAGCGGGADEGAGTIDVSGEVKFAGTPIPKGKIYFNPDGSKGNSGSSGWAEIEDGKYDTAAEGGKPTVGGAMTVSIEGFDPAQTSTDEVSGESLVKPLFPTYETTAELPQEDAVQNFDVPAEAANRKDGPEGGGGRINP